MYFDIMELNCNSASKYHPEDGRITGQNMLVNII